MSRITYTAEEIVSYYKPSELPKNFSSFGPVLNNNSDFQPLKMNNLYNIPNITVNNNKYDSEIQFAPITRSNSEQTSNWEPNMVKNPLTNFSSSANMTNFTKHHQPESMPDRQYDSSFQSEFPSVFSTPSNEQIPINEQQPQMPPQSASLPTASPIPQSQQPQQQQPQYPFMYLSQFYPFVNGPQTFAVYSQYQPQYQPMGYGRPPQPPFSQHFAYVNQTVIPQMLPTDQINMGIPPETQPQIQPQPHQQTPSMDMGYNPQYQPQPNQPMDLDQSQFSQQSQNSSLDHDENEDPALLMKYDFTFPSYSPQTSNDEEGFGSVLHPSQQPQPPQQPPSQNNPSSDKPFNPSRIPFQTNLNEMQLQSHSQPGSNDNRLEFPSVIPETDEFQPVIGRGFQSSSNFSVIQQPEVEESFQSIVSNPPNQQQQNIIPPDVQQFKPQQFDNSGFQNDQDEFSSILKTKMQPPQIDPTVLTFQPKKQFVSSSVPPKDTFNPQPIIRQSSAQPPQPSPSLMQQPPQLQKPSLQTPTLQTPPNIQAQRQSQAMQLDDKKLGFEAPTFAPTRINNLLRTRSVPVSSLHNESTNIVNFPRPATPQFQPPTTVGIQQQNIFQPQMNPNQEQQQHLEAPETQKEAADSTMKKFQPKPFNAIEVEEQKKPEIQKANQMQQNMFAQQPKSKNIKKRTYSGITFDPKPISPQFYFSPVPAPDINLAIKPRKDTFMGRRRVW